MQQESSDIQPVLDYASSRGRCRVHWRTVFIAAAIAFCLNLLPHFMPEDRTDGLEPEFGWPWVFDSSGGFGGFGAFDWTRCGLDVLFGIALALALGLAACRIARHWGGPS